MRAIQLLTLPPCLLFGLLFAAALPTSPLGAQEPPRVAVQTNAGTIVLELDSERAPTSVENFLGYVNRDFYDNTLFHRVIDGFMIQGGGFSPEFMRKRTRSPIRNEANNGLKNERYTIAMARTNAPHSATSQFFINTVDNYNLDHTAPTDRGWGYAVFGRVIDGFDVVDNIGAVATGSAGPFPRDVPKESVIIESMSLLNGEEAPAAPETTSDTAEPVGDTQQ